MTRRNVTAVAVVLTAMAGLSWFAQAGSLDPPGAPAPTMVTLQEIYDRVSASPVGIAKTGQTGCWDASGTPIACAGTGQDGEYQTGISVDPRFTDNGNGTVKDNLTGLIWLQDANCFGGRTWTSALSDANGLASASDTCTPDLTDGSVAGDWRLPNLRELQSLIDYQNFAPALPAGHPFSGVQSPYYWSSTADENTPYRAWYVVLGYGYVARNDKAGTGYVWPVRDGQ